MTTDSQPPLGSKIGPYTLESKIGETDKARGEVRRTTSALNDALKGKDSAEEKVQRFERMLPELTKSQQAAEARLQAERTATQKLTKQLKDELEHEARLTTDLTSCGHAKEVCDVKLEETKVSCGNAKKECDAEVERTKGSLTSCETDKKRYADALRLCDTSKTRCEADRTALQDKYDKHASPLVFPHLGWDAHDAATE